MKFLIHDYNAARAKAAEASEKDGKKVVPVLGYTDGRKHVLLEDGQHRRLDGKRRDVSGKKARKDRIAQRRRLEEMKARVIAKHGVEVGTRLWQSAVDAAEGRK